MTDRLRNILVLIVIVVLPALGYAFYPISYRFTLTASVVFDDAAYELKGFEDCHYQRVWLFGTDHSRLGGPIIGGYRVTTSKDAPSVTLANGQGALVLLWPGTCTGLDNLREGYLADPSYPFKAPLRAIYLPDRENPQRIWLLSDGYRAKISDEPGRLRFRDVTAKTDKNADAGGIKDNAPILWSWYQQQSKARHQARQQHTGYGGTSQQIWLGLFGCVVSEDEWKDKPEFSTQVPTSAGLSRVILKHAGHEIPCPQTRLRHISLVPSDDLRTATLDFERAELRWATIVTPYAPDVRSNEGWWTPEICIKDNGCLGFHMTRPGWLYVPSRRMFVYVNEERFESYDFTSYAMRPGDQD